MLIEYSSTTEDFKVYLLDTRNANNQRRGALNQENDDQKTLLISANIKLQDYVKLDNGTAFLGFTHDTVNLANMVSIDNWTFVSDARSN